MNHSNKKKNLYILFQSLHLVAVHRTAVTRCDVLQVCDLSLSVNSKGVTSGNNVSEDQ